MPRRGKSEGFHEALARLHAEAAKAPDAARQDRPDELPLRDINVCPSVFQPRAGGAEDGAHYPDHVGKLADRLRDMPAGRKVLDAITVYAIGRRFYALDGHHRLAAYRATGITEAVPVRYSEASTIEEAMREAFRLNAKVHLNLEQGERNEAAWRLVCIGEEGSAKRITVDEIVAASGVARRTVERMRALYRRLQAKFGQVDEWSGESVPATFASYQEAVEAEREGERQGFTEEMKEMMVAKIADALGKTFGKQAHKHPAIFGDGLKMYLGEDTLQSVAEHIGLFPIDNEEYEEFLDWKAGRDD